MRKFRLSLQRLLWISVASVLGAVVGNGRTDEVKAQALAEAAPLFSAQGGDERLCPPSHRSSVEVADSPVAGLPRTAGRAAAPAWSELDFDEAVAVGDAEGLRCSGVLLGPRQVLTARHCLPATRVLFGHDTARPLGRRLVVTTYTPRDPALDAALLILDQGVAIPPPLRRMARDTTPPLGPLRPVGFGSTRRRLNFAYGRKRFINLPAVGWGCDAGRARDTGCRSELELLLLPFRGKDTCEGDSGGPLYERFHERRRLVAITSRSTDGAHVLCGDGGIYVRLDRLADWLDPLLDNFPASDLSHSSQEQ